MHWKLIDRAAHQRRDSASGHGAGAHKKDCLKNRYEIDGDVTRIFITRKNGDVLVALIDTADLEIAQSRQSWNVCGKRTCQTHYVVSHHPHPCVLLHNLILPCRRGLEIDHKNHDGLDNRRGNLRIVTHAQNQLNRRGHGRRSDRTSPYLGVSKSVDNRYWVARVYSGGKYFYCGYFKNHEEARDAATEARLRLLEIQGVPA